MVTRRASAHAALEVARSQRPQVAILALEATAYLAKPYSPLALLDVVQRLSRG